MSLDCLIQLIRPDTHYGMGGPQSTSWTTIQLWDRFKPMSSRSRSEHTRELCYPDFYLWEKKTCLFIWLWEIFSSSLLLVIISEQFWYFFVHIPHVKFFVTVSPLVFVYCSMLIKKLFMIFKNSFINVYILQFLQDQVIIDDSFSPLWKIFYIFLNWYFLNSIITMNLY